MGDRVARQLRAIRAVQNYSQCDLAHAANISCRTIEGWEAGRYTPSARLMRQLLGYMEAVDLPTESISYAWYCDRQARRFSGTLII